MEFIDLTKEIYHGHEQEYIPIVAPLSLTESNSSLPTIWRHHQRSSTTHTKPLPPAYPRKRNDKLDTTIRNQMNDFIKYSTNPYIESEENTSILTPYQTAELNNNKKTHCITIKRHNQNIKNKSIPNQININNPFSRRSSTDNTNFVKINRLSNEMCNTYNGIENENNSPQIITRNAYLSNTTSIMSDTKGCSVSNYNDLNTYNTSESERHYKTKYNNNKKPIIRSVSNNSKNYINLSDIHINRDEYENDMDFYKNRDNIIKQYVQCSDKQKGTQNIIQIYLKKWKQEEMQNIPKIHYCFNHKSLKKSDKKSKKKKNRSRKKISKNRMSNSYDHNYHTKKHKKRYHKHKNKDLKKSDGNNSHSYIQNKFMIHSIKLKPKFKPKSPKKSVKNRNKSLDLIDKNHKFRINMNTKSVNDTFGIKSKHPTHGHDRNQTMPYFTNNFRKYNYNSPLSYSMSASSKTGSSMNTFYNIKPPKNIFIQPKNNGFIPQPRASIIEKTFTWGSDCNCKGFPIKGINITKPYIC